MPSMSALPGLEQLRHQAKELLRAVRSGDLRALSRMNAHLAADHLVPSHQYDKVHLAQALFVIAREHGFASWPKLKASMSPTSAQAPLEQPDRMMGNTSNALAPSGQQGVTSRAPVLTELAVELADLAEKKEAISLASRFSRLPRRDILGVREQLVARGAQALVVDTLLIGLESESPRVRYDAAHALDHCADHRCTGPLRRLLGDPVPRVRRMALHVLSCDACKLTPLSVPDDLADLVIDRALTDPSINVRRHATVALGSFCQDARVRQILQTLAAQEKDPAIVREARQALRRLGASSSVNST
jgi:hypothetical protein